MTTIKEQLENIAKSNKSSIDDEKFMLLVLNKLGYTDVVVTMGIVYLEGIGTLKNPPMSINSIANNILNTINHHIPKNEVNRA